MRDDEDEPLLSLGDEYSGEELFRSELFEWENGQVNVDVHDQWADPDCYIFPRAPEQCPSQCDSTRPYTLLHLCSCI